MPNFRFRPPLSYYGGKQKLAQKIVSLIPKHILYCEPFTGGAAVFFLKNPSEVEVLNDTNGELMNFYRVIKSDYAELERQIMPTLHSRDLHRQARVIYTNPDMFDPVKRAWAVWVLSSQSFSSKLDDAWDMIKHATTLQQTLQGKLKSSPLVWPNDYKTVRLNVRTPLI